MPTSKDARDLGPPMAGKQMKVEMQVPILGQKPQPVKVDPIQLFISGIGQILERLDQVVKLLENPGAAADDERIAALVKEAKIRKLADEEVSGNK